MPVGETKKQLRAVLSTKSVKELEELLALEFSEEEGFEPDIEYISEIMEVIREKDPPGEARQAAETAAWEEFREYMQASGADSGAPREAGKKKTPSRKPARILRYALAAAAVFALLCGTALASGQGLFRAIVVWTADTFRFQVVDQGDSVECKDPFDDLRRQMERAAADEPVIPNWAPEGTTVMEPLKTTPRTYGTITAGSYRTETDEIYIGFRVYDTLPEKYGGTYYFTKGTMTTYEAGGVIYYFYRLGETNCVAWVNGCVQGSIYGTLSMEQLKAIVDSIYEE